LRHRQLLTSINFPVGFLYRLSISIWQYD